MSDLFFVQIGNWLLKKQAIGIVDHTASILLNDHKKHSQIHHFAFNWIIPLINDYPVLDFKGS